MTDTDILKERLTKAIFRIYLMFPFYGFILERTKIVLSEKVETACVDSLGNMFISPEFLKTLTRDQTLFLLVHELHHLAMNHHGRRCNRDPKIWNVACDYVINLALERELHTRGISGTITGMLIDGKYDNKSSEQVYTDLLTSPPPDNKISDDLSYGTLEDKNGVEIRDRRVPLSEEEVFNNSKDWKKVAVEAATTAKMQGQLPGYLEQEVQKNCKPCVPWEQTLRNKLMDEYCNLTKWNFSFSNRNRRQTSQEYILPGNDWKRNKKPIVFAIDTSGSMNVTEFSKGVRELEQIRKLFDLDVLLLSFDTKIQDKKWIRSQEKLVLPTLKGGGGTTFAPIFSELENTNLSKSFVIVYTDGCGKFPAKPTNRVLWVCSTNTAIPWGDVARI